jgi:hypothetical protein
MTFMLQTLDYACFIKFHVVKKHDGVQVMLHAFLTPLTDEGEWPASRLFRFTSEMFVGSMAKDKFLPILGIEPRPSSPQPITTLNKLHKIDKTKQVNKGSE